MELASEEILLSLQQKYNYLRFLFVEFVISRPIGCIGTTQQNVRNSSMVQYNFKTHNVTICYMMCILPYKSDTQVMYTLNCSNSYMVLEWDRISVKQRSIQENRLRFKKIRIRQTVNNLLTVYMFSCRNSKKKQSVYSAIIFIWNIHLHKTLLSKC